jgi:hypothetical protein
LAVALSNSASRRVGAGGDKPLHAEVAHVAQPVRTAVRAGTPEPDHSRFDPMLIGLITLDDKMHLCCTSQAVLLDEGTLRDRPRAIPPLASKSQERNMLRRLAIVSGLATTSILGLATLSVLSVNLATPAYAGAGCSRNLEQCDQVVILVCGDDTYVGGSDQGSGEDIARIKARNAGYDPNRCLIRYR